MHRISLRATLVNAEQKYLVLLNVQQTVPKRSSLSSVSKFLNWHKARLTWVQVVDGEPSNPCSKALVEPELVPPVHGDQVTEPLMSKLVSHNISYPVTVAVCGGFRVEKYSSGAILISC